jgi:hypothetical protein
VQGQGQKGTDADAVGSGFVASSPQNLPPTITLCALPHPPAIKPPLHRYTTR